MNHQGHQEHQELVILVGLVVRSLGVAVALPRGDWVAGSRPAKTTFGGLETFVGWYQPMRAISTLTTGFFPHAS
jgi:hypothetical protein